MTSILDTLENYRMIDVKRERLEYIYQQNCAQAYRQAIPSPMSILNVVQSGNLLKAAVSVIYMAVDSKASYNSYKDQADLQYLQDGWELDDVEAAELHNSRKQAFTYMLSMVRDNNLPGDYALNEESVQNFVSWTNNPNVTRRIAFLESSKGTYQRESKPEAHLNPQMAQDYPKHIFSYTISTASRHETSFQTPCVQAHR